MLKDKRPVRVAYFALLREQSGVSGEVRDTSACDARELYEELRQQYKFTLSPSQLAVSINEELRNWNDCEIKPNDLVVYLPPVAGG